MDSPTAKPALKKLILENLARAYTSSGKDGIATGNHYQSVTLGVERTTGFRSDRDTFMDQLDFHERRVLDLGSNLGEISRAARARGAALVDGYEYDSFFVELAQTVNAYNGTTRVSFFQRDITDRAIYRERYDIVLALSVYIYLQDVLPSLADIIDGVLVLETHRLEHNLESTYLDPIGRFFPSHVFLGASDWGSGLDKAGQRAVIAFAKSDEGLRAHLTGIGLANREFGAVRCVGTELNIRAIDVKRTAWYDQFFNAFAFESPQELLTAVHRTDVDTEMLAQDRDFGENGMGGWVYWLIYVKGALQHAQGEALGAGNVYYDLLARHWKGDPGRVADYGNPERLRALVHRRFRDFALFRANPDAPLEVEPLRLVVTKGPAAPSPTRSVKRIYEIGSEVPVETTTIDGYHRLFLARLFGHAQMPCDFVAEHDAVPGQGA